MTLLEPLAFLLNRMMERLCARLAGRALALQELRLGLQLEGGAVHRRTLHFPLPTRDARTLLKLLQLDLEAHPPAAPVVKIALAAAPAKPRPPQGGLFAPLAPPPEKLELTLARLAGVVGEEQVGSAELKDTHRPDAFRTVKFSGVTARSQIQNATFKMQNANKLALRRFRPPRRAQVETRGGRPAEVRFGTVRGRVAELAGPWRTSGGWWTGEGWARDEWDAALALQPARDAANVLLCRIYRDLETGEWFVEGSYD